MIMKAMKCGFCEEPIAEGERADSRGGDFHRECLFRAVVGSAAHVMKRCFCYVKGSNEGDPEGLTRREAAQLAMDLHERKVLVMFTIYKHPADYPEGYMVRVWYVWQGRSVAGGADKFKTLKAARASIPRDLHEFGPAPGEDPVILGTWV